jgi:hypothetical protein
MPAVDQDDSGKVVWHAQRLQKSLNSGVFIHVHL